MSPKRLPPRASASARPGRVPLERALSKLGILSRTQARIAIEAGRVEVNGTVRRDPSFPVTPETARILVDGEPRASAGWKCLAFHKPKSCTVTRADEKGRTTVFDLVGAEASGLHAVGRLDFATTGLLLLTNDTRFSAYLTDPANGVPRVYVVEVRGELTPAEAVRARAGIDDEGERLRADRVEILKASGRESRLEVELSEGKNREIRRLFAALGHEVTKLKRISYGGLALGELKAGEWRAVDAEEARRAFPGAEPRDRRAGAGSGGAEKKPS